jgi:three-Cys-motif partner protein
MDKRGFIQEHSKIKLELCRLYLERYLSVLLATPFFERIVVSDVFAGCGVSKNEEKGSALIAAETIAEVRARHNKYSKQITLNLNDFDQNSCADLSTHLKDYDEFVSISCSDADQYLQTWSPATGSHNLFFIDPHGYTQVSTNNLRRLFTSQNCDFLIFVPINHIYRFLKPSDEVKSKKNSDFLPELGIAEKKHHVDLGKFYEPITKFLNGLGIEQTAAYSANSVDSFADVIVDALREISGAKYVYCRMIQNKEHNSKYSLFFISHHVLGAEKFLDAQSELKTKIEGPSQQQTFDFISKPELESILNFIDYDHPYDNVTLYEQGVKWGIRPTELKDQLKHLEKNNKNKIVIKELPGKRRNRGGLYIDYKHFRESDRIISITFRR